MIIDADLSLCLVTTTAGVISIGPQAETTVATHVSDQVIDLTHIPRNIIDSLYFVFQIEDAIVSGGAGGTLQIDLVTSAAVGLSTPQTLWSTGIVANATIVAWAANSTIYVIKVPPVMLLRYLGCNYTIATAVFTAGSWRAFFTPDAPFLIAATP